MRIVKCCLTLFLFMLLSITTFAHPGMTDENGGHYDYSTGEYHYHHGYPAHQHENGVCPYDFKDNTNNHSFNGAVNSSATTKSKQKSWFNGITGFILTIAIIAFLFALPILINLAIKYKIKIYFFILYLEIFLTILLLVHMITCITLAISGLNILSSEPFDITISVHSGFLLEVLILLPIAKRITIRLTKSQNNKTKHIDKQLKKQNKSDESFSEWIKKYFKYVYIIIVLFVLFICFFSFIVSFDK